MDWLTAVVEIIKAIVWPTVAFFLVYLLRAQIGELVKSIREGKVKTGSFELSIRSDLDAARRALAPEVVAIESGVLEKESEFANSLHRLASISPRTAILEAWRRVEASAYEAIRRHYPNLSNDKPLLLDRLIEQSEVLSSSVVKALARLRDARNRTAHAADFQPSIADAEEYIALALAVEHDLKRVGSTS